MNPSGKHAFRARERGFTLVELMISLVLGLLVVGAAGGLFMANKRTYAATEVISRLGESSRVSFELLARDIRQAAGNPCGRSIPVANVLNGASGTVYDFGTGITGYDGTSPPSWPTTTAMPAMVPGTDVLDMHSGSDSGVTIARDQTDSTAAFFVSQNGAVTSGDVVMVCDYQQATILQVTNANFSNATVVHNTGTGVPGNCTKNLGIPAGGNPCDSSIGQCNMSARSQALPECKKYGKNSALVKLQAVRWFLGQNARGKSLYRVILAGDSSTGNAVGEVDEITDKVDDLQFTYLVAGASSYVPASAAVDWKKVTAVHVDLVLKGTDKAASGNVPITRNVSFTVNLRNRVD